MPTMRVLGKDVERSPYAVEVRQSRTRSFRVELDGKAEVVQAPGLVNYEFLHGGEVVGRVGFDDAGGTRAEFWTMPALPDLPPRATGTLAECLVAALDYFCNGSDDAQA